jgi:hypothetical protein
MKEAILRTFKGMYDMSPLKVIVDALPEISTHLLIALQMWCIVFSVYLTAVILSIFLFILKGDLDVFNILWDFTKCFFYNGTFLEVIAWRIHLAFYFFCLLLTFTDFVE